MMTKRQQEDIRALGEAPAFPRFGEGVATKVGLTKREWMATQILAGIVAGLSPGSTEDVDVLARMAAGVADSLLIALQYPEDPPRE